jgi:SpoIID/LytB domain protein
LKGAGWGHGVGLCQIGALGMSLAGKNTNEILYHYYKQTQIKDIYE